MRFILDLNPLARYIFKYLIKARRPLNEVESPTIVEHMLLKMDVSRYNGEIVKTRIIIHR